MKVRYGQIALMLAGILLVSMGLTAWGGVQRSAPKGERLSVVAAFYPMYTAALRVAGNSDGVAVRCLTPPTTGCLHDHQLTPAERAVLDGADVLILNGAGAEAFLEPLLPQLSAVITDTAAGVLPDEEPHEHGSGEHDHNEHIWLDPTLYTAQVNAICRTLCEADPANEQVYRQNTEIYVAQITEVKKELNQAAAALAMDKAVLFHDSMAYFAQAWGLDVLGRLPVGEEKGFSASEVAQVADALRGQAAVLLYDDQYPQQMAGLAAYAQRSAVVSLCSAVTPAAGVDDAELWLWAMRENIVRLKEAAA